MLVSSWRFVVPQTDPSPALLLPSLFICHAPLIHGHIKHIRTLLTPGRAETPGKLLRKVRAKARKVAFRQRRDLRQDVHGEVHGRLEPGEPGIHCPHTPRARTISCDEEASAVSTINTTLYDTMGAGLRYISPTHHVFRDEIENNDSVRLVGG